MTFFILQLNKKHLGCFTVLGVIVLARVMQLRLSCASTQGYCENADSVSAGLGWGQESAFLTTSQMMLMLWFHQTYFAYQVTKGSSPTFSFLNLG